MEIMNTMKREGSSENFAGIPTMNWAVKRYGKGHFTSPIEIVHVLPEDKEKTIRVKKFNNKVLIDSPTTKHVGKHAGLIMLKFQYNGS